MVTKYAKENTMSDSNIPKKGTSEWVRNEKIINNNPALKQARDIKEGVQKGAGHYTNNGGKGSALRTDINSQQWKDNYDAIDWSKKDDTPKNYRLKINGRYVDEDQHNE